MPSETTPFIPNRTLTTYAKGVRVVEGLGPDLNNDWFAVMQLDRVVYVTSNHDEADMVAYTLATTRSRL